MDSLKRTSRFLMQATLGVNHATLKQVAATGIEPWLEQQLNAPARKQDTFQRSTRDIWQHFRQTLKSRYGASAIN